MATPDWPAEKGDYLIVFDCPEAVAVQVGRAGEVHLSPGRYAYSGSARGPGGIRARLGRHLRGGTRRHWHIDYLRAHLRPIMAGFVVGRERRECAWARRLRTAGASPVIAGLGATDCRCEGHFLALQRGMEPAAVVAEVNLRRLIPSDLSASL
ncbi:MAG: GIY-YIG nuclease family protein [Ectothiorhodospiraceae bacterium]|jgi:Uri superfamily endonuclease